jgi:hypothetical protein
VPWPLPIASTKRQTLNDRIDADHSLDVKRFFSPAAGRRGALNDKPFYGRAFFPPRLFSAEKWFIFFSFA